MAASSKEQKIQDLKKNLAELQEKLADLEEKPRRIEVKQIFTWASPSRVYRKKSKRWFLNLVLLVLIILVILLFVKQFLLMAVVLSMGFLFYVMDAVPPEEVEHSITTQGLISGDQSFIWDELYDFWFLQKGDFTILAIDTFLNYPRRLLLLVPEEKVEKIKKEMVEYIPFRERPKISWLDRLGERLAGQFQKLTGS